MTATPSPSRASWLWTAFGVCVALALLWMAGRALDLETVWRLLGGIGPAALLLLFPYIALQLWDAIAWRRLLTKLGHPVALHTAWLARVSTDSMLFSAPAGVVVADGLKAAVLKHLRDVPVSLTFATLALRKSFIWMAHGLAIFIGVALGASLYARLGEHIGVGVGVEVLAAGLAIGLIFAGLITPWLLARGRVASRAHSRLTVLTPRFIRKWLEREQTRFQDFDQHFIRYLDAPISHRVINTTLYLMTWIMEAVEAYIILRLLGVDIGFHEALVIETAAAVIRAVAFFVPAGLGFQDLGYAGFLVVLGVPAPLETATAFSLLKRSRELLWVVIGYSTLGVLRRRSLPVAEVAMATAEVRGARGIASRGQE